MKFFFLLFTSIVYSFCLYAETKFEVISLSTFSVYDPRINYRKIEDWDIYEEGNIHLIKNEQENRYTITKDGAPKNSSCSCQRSENGILGRPLFVQVNNQEQATYVFSPDSQVNLTYTENLCRITLTIIDKHTQIFPNTTIESVQKTYQKEQLAFLKGYADSVATIKDQISKADYQAARNNIAKIVQHRLTAKEFQEIDQINESFPISERPLRKWRQSIRLETEIERIKDFSKKEDSQLLVSDYINFSLLQMTNYFDEGDMEKQPKLSELRYANILLRSDALKKYYTDLSLAFIDHFHQRWDNDIENSQFDERIFAYYEPVTSYGSYIRDSMRYYSINNGGIPHRELVAELYEEVKKLYPISLEEVFRTGDKKDYLMSFLYEYTRF